MDDTITGTVGASEDQHVLLLARPVVANCQRCVRDGSCAKAISRLREIRRVEVQRTSERSPKVDNLNSRVLLKDVVASSSLANNSSVVLSSCESACDHEYWG